LPWWEKLFTRTDSLKEVSNFKLKSAKLDYQKATFVPIGSNEEINLNFE
jgi:hypothetical protein